MHPESKTTAEGIKANVPITALLNTGGTLSVTDSTHTANIALLGNYMASSFVPSSDGHGGTLVTDPPANQQPLLTHPHA